MRCPPPFAVLVLVIAALDAVEEGLDDYAPVGLAVQLTWYAALVGLVAGAAKGVARWTKPGAGAALLRHSWLAAFLFPVVLALLPAGNGISFRDSADNHAENVTLYGSPVASGLLADSAGGDLGGTCSKSLVCTTTGKSCSSGSACPNGICTAKPQGCSFGARNVLTMNNREYGFRALATARPGMTMSAR